MGSAAETGEASDGTSDGTAGAQGARADADACGDRQAQLDEGGEHNVHLSTCFLQGQLQLYKTMVRYASISSCFY